MKKNRFFRCLVALCLICAMMAPVCASAAVIPPANPQASYYLAGYRGYITRSGNTVQVTFSVTGTNTMDDIGVLSIKLYESTDGNNYYWVKTFQHDTTSGMLGHNTSYKSGTVNYSGYASRYYMADICFYAGDSTGHDTRYYITYG